MRRLVGVVAFVLPVWGQVVLRPGTAVVVGSQEAGAVRMAAADLAEDLDKVLGGKARLAESAAQGPSIVINPRGVERPTSAETFRIAVDGSTVVITGADVRGTIYGIYEFSQRFLGVDPLY